MLAAAQSIPLAGKMNSKRENCFTYNFKMNLPPPRQHAKALEMHDIINTLPDLQSV